MNIAIARVIFAIVVVVSAAPCEAADASQIEGKWYQADYIGFREVNDKCGYSEIHGRRFDIRRLPTGALGGTYRSEVQRIWTKNADLSCKFEAGSFAFMQGLLWSIDLQPSDAGTWDVDARFPNCAGSACDTPLISKGNFRTRIRRLYDELEDTGGASEGSSQGGLLFVTEPLATQRADSAADQLDALLRPLDSGECNQFFVVSVAGESALRQQQAGFCAAHDRARSILPPIVGTSTPTRIYLTRSWNGSTYTPAQAVLLSGALKYQTGTTGPRSALLTWSGQGWRVFALDQ